MRNLSTRQLATAGLIASSYTILSLVFQPISFGVYQVRIAEALTVLPFLTPAAIPGLYIGCLVANILGGMGWLDIIIGPLITLVAAILTWQTTRLDKRTAATIISVVTILLMWVGGIYLLNGFHYSMISFIGLCLSVVAILIIVWGLKSTGRPITGRRYRIVVGSALILTLIAIIFLRRTDDFYFLICGGLILIAVNLGITLLLWIRRSQQHLGLLIAPLPPVVLNAFGVSLYLAPIIGVNYWFCVQMIGIGQLIACYVIGLPLLLIFRKRHIFG